MGAKVSIFKLFKRTFEKKKGNSRKKILQIAM